MPVNEYKSLRDKTKKQLTAKQTLRSTDEIRTSKVKDRLAALKKDLTWTDLPDVRNVKGGKLTPDDAVSMAMDLMQTTPMGALAGVIKDKGGNWFGDSVKKALNKLKESLGETDPARLAEVRLRMNDPNLGSTGEHLGKWVDGPLQKYVKNRMATPDDEIRKLADQGILHVDPEQLNFNPEMYGKFPSANQRYTAVSPQAKIWEGVSDNSIGYDRARTFVRGADANEYYKAFIRQNPWIEKLDPETPVYDLADDGGVMRDLGFDHLMDELSNALDEGSGLPQNLRLTPEGLQGLSVEEAVKKVNGINKFRAEKAKKANARFAAAEGIPVYKEYPEGYRWLEYKKPDELPKGWEQVTTETGNTAYKNAEGKMTLDNPSRTQLDSWLKQEGDTMGHCVGGYCDDVATGKSRILSLRDHEGKSVATVELSPHISYGENPTQSWMINQIKGAGNKKPPKEALPFIQDFVKSGQWGDVQDLHNADLLHYSVLPKEEQLLVNSDYLTMDEIKKLREGKPWTPIDNDPELPDIEF